MLHLTFKTTGHSCHGTHGRQDHIPNRLTKAGGLGHGDAVSSVAFRCRRLHTSAQFALISLQGRTEAPAMDVLRAFMEEKMRE
ncbi:MULTISPECIES: hypothetical protein [Cupriavidus]|uniref:hypothetical protein n=1 Tax=Cupriavidus sp. DF5525 TaxID=3160989 RepID=UPI0032E02412